MRTSKPTWATLNRDRRAPRGKLRRCATPIGDRRSSPTTTRCTAKLGIPRHDRHRRAQVDHRPVLGAPVTFGVRLVGVLGGDLEHASAGPPTGAPSTSTNTSCPACKPKPPPPSAPPCSGSEWRSGVFRCSGGSRRLVRPNRVGLMSSTHDAFSMKDRRPERCIDVGMRPGAKSNRVVIALHRCAVATMDASRWLELVVRRLNSELG